MSILATIPKLFNRRWWWTTLIIIAGVYVLIQLGFWQLDRLEQRRAFNQRVAERWREEPYDVNTNAIPADLSELEYRRVEASGEFDYEHQIVLKNQSRNQAPGSIIVTPLVLDDNRAVLVARGWVPINLSTPEHWDEYQEPADHPVIGLVQESQTLPNGAVPTPPPAPQVEWFYLNISAVQPQMPYELLPVFILQLPEEGRSLNTLPMRGEPLVLDEGSHFSYAMQWFMFAMILGVGYLFFINTQELREQRIANSRDLAEVQDADAPKADDLTDVAPMSHREGHA
ncbi:MAG: SURF1 family protein [Caldilineaceae bacterium]|nr:SURF1 family protein [Caldilineaceae bacterium]